MKIFQIIVLNIVLFTARSSILDFYNCLDYCAGYTCDQNSCDDIFVGFVELVFSFQEDICTEFFYTKVTPTTNSELATQLAGCLDVYADTQSGDIQTFSQCTSDCVLIEDDEYDNFLFKDAFDQFDPGLVCVIEVYQTSDSCQMDSPCLNAYKYDVRQVEIENQISDCEEWRLNYNLTEDQQNQLISNCFSSYATIMTQENVQTPNTYHNDLIYLSQGVSDCITVKNYNLAVGINNNDDDEEEEEDPNQDCKANFCLSEFDTCQGQCTQYCVTSDCFGDTIDGYISYYAESQCQTALLQLNQLRKDKNYINSTFQTSYLSCIEQLETTYATDSKVLEYLTCQKACKDKKPVEEEEEKEESAQIKSFIGSCLVLLFLIF